MTPAERNALSAAKHRALEVIPERQAMIVEDLAALPKSPLVVAEGTLLPPDVADPERSVWLMPTKDFQARHREDPERRTHPMDVVIAAVNERGIPMVIVDGTRPVEEIADEVEANLADALSAGPAAVMSSGDGRCSVRRTSTSCAKSGWAALVRGPPPNPELQVRRFTCECGREQCQTDIDAMVGTVAANPVVASGHEPNRQPLGTPRVESWP